MEILVTNGKARVIGNTVEYIEPLKKGSDSTVLLEFIYPQDKKITDFLVTPTCGCTTSSTYSVENKTKTSLRYDTYRIGEFNKTIAISYKQDGNKVQTIIKYKGQVLDEK